MDIVQFFNLLTRLLPFILVINGLTQVSGLWLKGRAQMIFALVTGLIIGELGFLAVFGIPIDFTGYVSAGIVGLFIAVISVLFYDMLKEIFAKAMSSWMRSREEEASGLAMGETMDFGE